MPFCTEPPALVLAHDECALCQSLGETPPAHIPLVIILPGMLTFLALMFLINDEENLLYGEI